MENLDAKKLGLSKLKNAISVPEDDNKLRLCVKTLCTKLLSERNKSTVSD